MKCDGCKKQILQGEFIQISLDFKVKAIDKVTGEVESLHTLSKLTKNTYCYNCFGSLVRHLSNFREEVNVSSH